MKRLTIKVPGKIILSGEYAVVYGQPAVVAAVDRTLIFTIEWTKSLDREFFRELLKEFETEGAVAILEKVKNHNDGYRPPELKSNIPIGCGMGSSAALASALSLMTLVLAGEDVDLDRVNHLAFNLERKVHLKPSGVDNTVVTFGGVMKYCNEGESIKLDKLSCPEFLKNVLVVNTGVPAESTGEMVAKVRNLAKKNAGQVDKIIRQIGQVTEQIIRQDRVAEAIRDNERALEMLGVVGKKAQMLIREIEKRGGVAKISGAGGYRTNSGVIMVYAPNNKKVMEYLETTGMDYFPIKVSEGIQYLIE